MPANCRPVLAASDATDADSVQTVTMTMCAPATILSSRPGS
jgi:hypothetical protein